MHYTPKGVCAHDIELEIKDGKISFVKFTGGCSGNTQGVAKLVEGMDPHEAIRRMKGIKCGSKPTSCPDQLSLALEAALAAEG